jgi:hypothetical protein
LKNDVKPAEIVNDIEKKENIIMDLGKTLDREFNIDMFKIFSNNPIRVNVVVNDKQAENCI